MTTVFNQLAKALPKEVPSEPEPITAPETAPLSEQPKKKKLFEGWDTPAETGAQMTSAAGTAGSNLTDDFEAFLTASGLDGFSGCLRLTAAVRGPEPVQEAPTESRESLVDGLDVATLQEVEGQEWWWGGLTRQQAATVLFNEEPGTFLVRTSSHPGFVTLSYKNDSGAFDNILARKDSTGWRLGESLLTRSGDGGHCLNPLAPAGHEPSHLYVSPEKVARCRRPQLRLR